MKRATLLPWVVTAAGACSFAAWSIHRHDRFATAAYDLGIFDQTVWGYSHFRMAANTVKRIPNLLGDHFHPLLTVLAPLYWVWNDARVLLVAQAALIALASVPIFVFARQRLGVRAAVLFQAAFLVSWPVLAAVSFDFHEVALAAPLLSWSLLAAVERRNLLLWSVVPFALLVREDVALAYIGIALYIGFVQRRVRLAAALATISFAWLQLVTHYVIPAIADRPYAYWNYEVLGRGSAVAVALGVVERPWTAASLFVDRGVKRATLALLLGTWAFLPLLSPLSLVALPLLAERFWSNDHVLWGTGEHYSLLLGVVLAFAAVETVARMQRFGARAASVAPVAVAAAALALTFGHVRPFRGVHPMFSAQRAAAVERCLRLVPPNVSVAASDVFVPHLSHRPQIAPLDRRRADAYLVVNTAKRSARRVLASIDRTYRFVCRGGEAAVLRRV